MLNGKPNKRALIEGKAALIVIDIQKSTFAPIPDEKRSIAHMPDYADRMARTKIAIDRAREVGIPVVFIQEIHLRLDELDDHFGNRYIQGYTITGQSIPVTARIERP